jgi:mRNA interferase MazF
VSSYIPARGDIAWLNFDPSTGIEMAGHHMALVVSHKILNEKTGRAIVCPITSKVKEGRPLDVVLPEKITGKMCAIVPDQIKSIDYTERKMEFVSHCPEEYLSKVIKVIFACIGGN